MSESEKITDQPGIEPETFRLQTATTWCDR